MLILFYIAGFYFIFSKENIKRIGQFVNTRPPVCCKRPYIENIDYKETFSSIIYDIHEKYDTVRLVLLVATVIDLDLIQFDMKTVFLCDDLKEIIYMEQSTGFELDDPYVFVTKKFAKLK